MNLITEPHTLTDFEKLQFALAYIKELKALLSKAEVEIGMLKSEIEELKDVSNNTKKLGEYKRIIRETTIKLSNLNTSYERLMSNYLTLQNKTNGQQV